LIINFEFLLDDLIILGKALILNHEFSICYVKRHSKDLENLFSLSKVSMLKPKSFPLLVQVFTIIFKDEIYVFLILIWIQKHF
jgi:hypothetical protein